MCAGLLSKFACKLQQAWDEIVSKLTPEGQETVTQIVENLQLISCAALQPLYDFIGEKYAEQIKAINASADADKLEALGQMLGVGDINCGAGPLHDDCKGAQEIEALVSTFSEENQKVIGEILGDIYTGVKTGLKPLLAINYVLNQESIASLVESEDQAVLEQLAQLYDQ